MKNYDKKMMEKLWYKDIWLKKLLGKKCDPEKPGGTSLFFILGKSTISVHVCQWMSEHTTAKVNENISERVFVSMTDSVLSPPLQ